MATTGTTYCNKSYMPAAPIRTISQTLVEYNIRNPSDPLTWDKVCGAERRALQKIAQEISGDPLVVGQEANA